MTKIDWDQLLAECVGFAQRLIRTPSMPREEQAIAELIAAELQALDFDRVWIDEIGNVNGRIRGRKPGLGVLVLNSHLDHVDPGDPDLWPSPPYAAEIVDGRIVGRGACDIKGPLAVQVYAMAALLRAGERPQRDVVFSGVVQEEIGGAGALHWVENLDFDVDLVVLGEPSRNGLALGHRGIAQMWVTFNGRSVHASAPEKGRNPNYALATFLQRLPAAKDELSRHSLLGPTSVAPTVIEVDTTSPNVTPAWTRVLLDFRTASESIHSLQGFVHRLAGDWPHTITNALNSPPAPYPEEDEPVYGFDTPADSDLVQRVQKLIGAGMGKEPELISYRFATDGRHFVPYGIPVVGFGPGEETQAHTAGESIPIAQIDAALRGYTRLLREF